MSQFLLGLLTMGAGVIGLFFVRFWRSTRDPLFMFFAFAFWLLALNWALLAFVALNESQTPLLYLLRLGAFVMIIVAIGNKNRRMSTE